jgi:molecular chaperone GrpE
MAKNGKSEVDTSIDLERELPENGSPDEKGTPENQSAPTASATAQSQEVERLKAERDTLYDRLARQQAEFENVRRRSAREQAEFREYAAKETVRALLPIVDSFERALKSNASPDDFRSGVDLIYRQLQDALARIGVQPLNAQGQPFDPRLHEAVEMVDTNDAPDNHVLDELQRGYKFKDQLLRPAMVRVARKK